MHNIFHNELSSYVKDKDNENATRVILREVAISLINNKEDFIEVLRSAGINIVDNATDVQLIDSFVKNAPNNKGLLLGASLLINHRNQGVNFDGESELSDAGVKATYKELDDYFNCCGEQHSNVVATMVAGALKGGVDLANKITDKKNASSNALIKQQEARKQLIQNVLASKQKETDEKNANARSQKKILIIVGSSVLVLVLIVGITMFIKSNKIK